MEGGPVRKIPVTELRDTKATVLYIGRIPHGFYENEMEGLYFSFLMWLWVYCRVFMASMYEV